MDIPVRDALSPSLTLQSYVHGSPSFAGDVVLHGLLDRWWPAWRSCSTDLNEWDEFCCGDAYEGTWHIERDAPPRLVMHTIDGDPVDRLRMSPTHVDLLRRSAPAMQPAFTDGGTWQEHFLRLLLLADAGLICNLVITSQTAYALAKYSPQLAASWNDRLLSGHSWGATWFTEVQGGTDLGANTVEARPNPTAPSGGDDAAAPAGWLLSGDKFFCSGAGLTDIALVTARPAGAAAGPRGLALFAVPRVRADGTLNFRITRLKDKGGTRSVPSGEVRLDNSEAWILSTDGSADDGLGIYRTLENLTLSRVSNAAGATGLARQALLEARQRMDRRHAFGAPLAQQPLVQRDLIELTVRLAACEALTLCAASRFQLSCHETPPFSDEYQLTRAWSHLAKSRTAEHAIVITQRAMELFGGIGFVDDVAIARLHREALVTPVWEGATNVQALDLMEALERGALQPLIKMIEQMLSAAPEPMSHQLGQRLERECELMTSRPAEQRIWHAVSATRSLADIAATAILWDAAAAAGGSAAAQLSAIAACATEMLLNSGDIPAYDAATIELILSGPA